MQRLAQDVDALRDHLGHQRTWLLGHSYGGFVALEYALSFPERLVGLVLLDTDSTGPRPETVMAGLQRLGVPPQEMAALATEVETSDDMFALFDSIGSWYLPHSAPGTARAVLGQTIYRAGGNRGGERALDGWDVTARLGEIDVPTLVVTGADDFMFPPQIAQRLGEALPRGEVVIVEGSGHLPFIERTDTSLDAIRDFLGHASGGSSSSTPG